MEGDKATDGWMGPRRGRGSRSLLTWFLRLLARSQTWGKTPRAEPWADAPEINVLTSQSLTSPRSASSLLPCRLGSKPIPIGKPWETEQERVRGGLPGYVRSSRQVHWDSVGAPDF